jgi:hypothetical protein
VPAAFIGGHKSEIIQSEESLHLLVKASEAVLPVYYVAPERAEIFKAKLTSLFHIKQTLAIFLNIFRDSNFLKNF